MPYKDPEQRRKYQRRWAAQRRADFFKDKVCARCGAWDGLELHHVYKEQKVASAIWTWGESRRQQELAKCVVICFDCHRIEHRPERQARMRAMNEAA